MKTLSKYPKVRDEMLNVIKQKIRSELCELAKKSNVIMNTSSKNLMKFDSQKLFTVLMEKAPYFFDILKCIVKKENCITTAASVLMYGHSERMSQLQYIVGLSLDRCGLTKEGLQLMHDLGICVSPRSVLRKKKELVGEQEESIDSTVTAYVRGCEKSALMTESVFDDNCEGTCTSETGSTPAAYDGSRDSLALDSSERSHCHADNCEGTCTSETGSTPAAYDGSRDSLALDSSECSHCHADNCEGTCTSEIGSIPAAYDGSRDSLALDSSEPSHCHADNCEGTCTSEIGSTSAAYDGSRDSLALDSSEPSHCHAGVSNRILNCDSKQSLRLPSIEMLGDNVDVTITPSKMTTQSQRKSLHWFLLMMKQKRITVNDMDISELRYEKDILTLPKTCWIPDTTLQASVMENMKHHICHILLKYVDFLKPLECVIPPYISHQFTELTRKKSFFLNCELIEASENSASGMISIMQRIHELSVPHARMADKRVIERVVFGGDVLTNERAFTAQQNMQLYKCDVDRLVGLIHRPEGLHREMNFLLGIYQQFYSEESSSDKGSLYHLRNFMNRRNVTGPEDVISNFRSHLQFVDDVTDAYILGNFMDNMDMDVLSAIPKKLPPFSLLSKDQIINWIMQEVEKIMDNLQLNNFESLNFIHTEISKLDADEKVLKSMISDTGYECALCGKAYSKKAWFQNHLQKKHDFVFSDPSLPHLKMNPVHCFLQMSLFLRDTIDSYKMGDGDRIVRNAYFEWLYASSLHHTKYTIWLWRMIAYVDAVLTPAESAEYKWNMTVNLKGGLQNNIPNDNCVELQVGNIKRQLNTQGSNKSFQSAQNICMTTQVVEDIIENLQRTTKSVKSKRTRPEVDKAPDIVKMVEYLRKCGPIKDIEWEHFSSFKAPFNKIHPKDLFEWISKQQQIASVFM